MGRYKSVVIQGCHTRSLDCGYYNIVSDRIVQFLWNIVHIPTIGTYKTGTALCDIATHIVTICWIIIPGITLFRYFFKILHQKAQTLWQRIRRQRKFTCSCILPWKGCCTLWRRRNIYRWYSQWNKLFFSCSSWNWTSSGIETFAAHFSHYARKLQRVRPEHETDRWRKTRNRIHLWCVMGLLFKVYL